MIKLNISANVYFSEVGEREPKQFKLNVLAACTAAYILIKSICYNIDDHGTWQAELQTEQCTVTRFASGKRLA